MLEPLVAVTAPAYDSRQRLGSAIPFSVAKTAGITAPLTETVWSAPDGSPAAGTGATFSTSFNTAGTKTVTATLNDEQGESGQLLTATTRLFLYTFLVTTYYSPREESFPGARNVQITCDRGDGHPPVTLSVRQSWLNEIAIEGWGRVDMGDPLYAGQFVSYAQEGMIRDMRPHAMGVGRRILTGCRSLAVDPSVIPLDTDPVLFTLPRQTNGWGPDINGRADDTGEAITGYHIDFYVGVRADPNSAFDDRFIADTFPNISVTW